MLDLAHREPPPLIGIGGIGSAGPQAADLRAREGAGCLANRMSGLSGCLVGSSRPWPRVCCRVGAVRLGHARCRAVTDRRHRSCRLSAESRIPRSWVDAALHAIGRCRAVTTRTAAGTRRRSAHALVSQRLPRRLHLLRCREARSISAGRLQQRRWRRLGGGHLGRGAEDVVRRHRERGRLDRWHRWGRWSWFKVNLVLPPNGPSLDLSQACSRSLCPLHLPSLRLTRAI